MAVAPGRPLATALVAPGADQPLDVGLHQQLQHSLRHGSQKIALARLLQQLGQHQSLFGHRILSRASGLKSCNSTLAAGPDGHLNYTAARCCGLTRNSTTTVDANALRLMAYSASQTMRFSMQAREFMTKDPVTVS